MNKTHGEVCDYCKSKCLGRFVDFGIGPYEYWGHMGCDTNIQWVSDCCDAPVVDENGDAVEPPDDEPDGDRAYDEMKDAHMEKRSSK